MKKWMAARWVLALALIIGFAAPAQAQTKIGIVDLRKVFDGYWRKKQADQMLKERLEELRKTEKSMYDDYQKKVEEYKTLSASAADQAVSTEERDKRKKSAESKLVEIQDIERQIRQYRSDSAGRIEEQKRRYQENVLRYIRESVTSKARAGNYNLILDSSADPVTQTQLVLFSSGLNDLTDEVLTDLNANAQPGILDDKPAPGASPEKRK